MGTYDGPGIYDASIVGSWRRRDIRCQLITLYGFTGAVLSACMVGIVAFGVFHVKSTVIDTSSEKLLEQMLSIQQNQVTEAGDVFTTKMDLGLSTFVLPFAHLLWESHQADFPLVGGPTFWDYPEVTTGLTTIPRFGQNNVRLDAGTSFWSGMPVTQTAANQSALSSRLERYVKPTNHMATFLGANFVSETNIDWVGTFYTTARPGSSYTTDPLANRSRPLLTKSYPGRVIAPRCDCGANATFADDTLGAKNPNCMLPTTGCKSETKHMQSLLLTGSACAIMADHDVYRAKYPACRKFESRSADFTTRPWYAKISSRPTPNAAKRWGQGWADGPIAAVTTSTSTSGYRPGYSAPHRWVISGMPFTLSIGVTAMLPDDGDGRYLSELGTIHTDMSIPSVQKFVDISAHKTGVAHLFQMSGKVVASKMWNLERDSGYSSSDGLDWERVKNGVDVDNLKIIGRDDFETLQDVPTFAEARIRHRIANWEQDEEWERMSENSGSFTVDDKYAVVYAKVGSNKDFVTCVVTRKVEILQSIAEQTDEIDASAKKLFLSVLIAVAVVGSLIVVVAVVLAIRISTPLVFTAKNAKLMAENIGDDLLKGVKGGGQDSCGPGISEMQNLTAAFEDLVNERKKLHATNEVADNPFFGVPLGVPSATTSRPIPWQTQAKSSSAVPLELPSITVATAAEQTALVQHPETRVRHSGQPLRVWMYGCFVIPVAIACIAITVLTAVRVTSEANSWTDPVQLSMIDEALNGIKERTALRADLVGITLASCINALRLRVDVTEGILDGRVSTTAATTGFAYKSPYVAPSSPCYGNTTEFNCPSLTSEPIHYGNEGRQSGKISYKKAGWFAPPANSLQDYKFSNPAASWSSVSEADVHDVTKRFARDVLPAIDAVNRIVYMSYPVDNIYDGYFGHPNDRNTPNAVPPELFFIYPYGDKSVLQTINQDCRTDTGGDIKSTTTSAYTPICRPWFWDVWKNAPAAPIPVVNRTATFAGLDLASNNGKPFLNLAMPLYKGGKLVGVTAVEAALGQISRVLSTTPVLQHGYAYLIDRNGMVIYHPHYVPDKSWSKATFDTKSHILHIEGTTESGRSSRFSRVWEEISTAEPGKPPLKVEWSPADPLEDEDDLWYAYYQSVPDTPYILVMTVPKADVIAPVTEMLDDVSGTVNLSITLFVLVSAAAIFVIVLATTYLGKTVAGPIDQLATLLANGAADGYQSKVRDAIPEPRSSKQMQQMAEAAEKLLCALRFGNAKYDGGDKIKALENDLKALHIVEELDMERGEAGRGLGVCLNNIGNCVNTLDVSKQRLAFTGIHIGQLKGVHLRSDDKITVSVADSHLGAIQLLARAVENAKKLAVKEALPQTVIGTRLLGKAVAHFSRGDDANAADAYRSALQVFSESASFKHVAQAAYMLPTFQTYQSSDGKLSRGSSAEMLAGWVEDGQVAVPFDELVLALFEETVDIVPSVLKSHPLPEDGSALLMLAIANAKFKRDPSWILAALGQAPRARASLVRNAATWLKFLDPSRTPLLDGYMRGQQGYVPGNVATAPNAGAGPKSIVFLIDRTWDPIVLPAIQSVTKIFNEHIQNGDKVGLFSLGEGWLIPLTQKNTGTKNVILGKIRAAGKVSGAPLLYHSMAVCLRQLQDARNPWLIALTDTVNLELPGEAESTLKVGGVVLAPGKHGWLEQGRVVNITATDSVTVAWEGSTETTEVIKGKCQVLVHDEPADDEFSRRLRKAGARVGEVTISLMWENPGTDLDLHVELPNGAKEINWQNKKSGGGYLDVDMQKKSRAPVENCFFQQAAPGRYRARVRNFGGRAPKAFQAMLRAKVPVELTDVDTGETTKAFQGARIKRGTCRGEGPSSDVLAFDFVVKADSGFAARAEGLQANRTREVLSILELMTNLNLVVINSRQISGWNPRSPNWPRFKSNMSRFVDACGTTGHELGAANVTELAARFEEVASMMEDSGLAEAL